MPKQLNWLHISDLHFKAADEYQRDTVLNSFIKSLPELISRRGKPDVVFVTGDIAHAGKPAEYAQATKFLDQLIEMCHVPKNKLFLIPGNHDVDRTKGKGLARSLLPEAADEYFDPSEHFLHLTTRQGAFISWYNGYFSGIDTLIPNTTTSEPRTVICNGIKLAVVSINSATFCLDDSDHGKLWVGRRCLEKAEIQLSSQDDALRFVLMHHPFEWLSSDEQASVRSKVRAVSDFILGGHLHENNAEAVLTSDDQAIHLTAGATYQTKKYPNTAMFCSVRDEYLHIYPIRYEDKPREVWVTDPSMYPHSQDYSGKLKIPRLSEDNSAGAPKVTQAAGHTSSSTAVAPVTKSEFEQDLFTTPLGLVLYAKPRLMTAPHRSQLETSDQGSFVEVAEIVNSSISFIIEARAEYGATSLTKRLAHDIGISGTQICRKDARRLPTYKKKLDDELSQEVKLDGSAVLILDNVSDELDEKLLKLLIESKWFSRIIAVTVSRGIGMSAEPVTRHFDQTTRRVYLWPMARDDVRDLACTLFSTNDQVLISKVVDKVYSDLLDLCIPLTPPTVIMYLKVLHREGEFHPLNRVDIMARYLDDMLRRSSDAYSDTFSVKNKLDVVSSFAYHLHLSRNSGFDERGWFNFVAEYQERTLTDFDGEELLSELISCRVFVKIGRSISVRYSFFYAFLIGRHLASRDSLLNSFVEAEGYYDLPSVIDVITGLRSDNSKLLETLTLKMEQLFNDFTAKYFVDEFDPLLGAIWPMTSNEDKLWQSVATEIENGPRSVTEIDILKSSFIAEARTADQQVIYQEFTRLEHNVFHMGNFLADALMNSDDVEGSLKLRAFEGVLRSHLVSFQIGSICAPLLAQNRYFRWGGIIFVDFHRIDPDLNPEKAIGSVIVSLAHAVANVIGERLGAHKLAGVFKARSNSHSDGGILDLMTFNCAMAAKGTGWQQVLEKAIYKTDKDAYYLSLMLDSLRGHLRNEILQAKDRDALKWLIALIETKRSSGKQAPGAKFVKRVQDRVDGKTSPIPAYRRL